MRGAAQGARDPLALRLGVRGRVRVVGPAGVPGAAFTVNDTSRDGGTIGTETPAGLTVIPAGRSGKVTVGVPA